MSVLAPVALLGDDFFRWAIELIGGPQPGKRIDVARSEPDDQVDIQREPRVSIHHGREATGGHVLDSGAVERGNEETDETRRGRHA